MVTRDFIGDLAEKSEGGSFDGERGRFGESLGEDFGGTEVSKSSSASADANRAVDGESRFVVFDGDGRRLGRSESGIEKCTCFLPGDGFTSAIRG